MPRDLHQLLHDTAVEPDHAPDVDQFVRRGHRRRRIRHGAIAVGSAAVLVAVVTVGVNVAAATRSPQIADQPPTPTPTPTATPTTTPSPSTDAGGAAVLTPVECPPNARCTSSFHLDDVQYMTTIYCDQVTPSAVGEPIDVTAEVAGDAVPEAVYALDGFPAEVGVAVDWQCNDRALAVPVDVPADREHALQQARVRCQTLEDPPPSDRCGLGGDAQWRAGDAWNDNAFAPFPETVEATDLAIEAGEPDSTWRTDPLKVATRRFADEGVCKDEQDTPCPWDVTLTYDGEDQAIVEGTVNPFPHVTWDIRIMVERLGEYSWWTTRMTIEPRPAE